VFKPVVRKRFLDHFYADIDKHGLDNTRTTINLHIIKISNNSFDIDPLLKELLNSMTTFCLSKKEYKQYVDEERYGELAEAARERFRDYQSNEGEFGELLLYCLLETHLEAPKIFTKMNLKTSHNDYVKGADGVHLLKVDENEYQIIFGESKMYKTLKGGLDKAFESIDSFLNHSKNNVAYELQLLNSHLQQEILEEAAYLEIKKIIFPSAVEDEYQTEKAFGIFVGFNLEVEKELKRLNSKEFQQEIRKHINNTVKKEFKRIEKLIEKYELYGYNFYIYCIPFMEIGKIRQKAIQKLKGEIS
jgi:Cap4 SAVED domain